MLRLVLALSLTLASVWEATVLAQSKAAPQWKAAPPQRAHNAGFVVAMVHRGIRWRRRRPGKWHADGQWPARLRSLGRDRRASRRYRAVRHLAANPLQEAFA